MTVAPTKTEKRNRRSAAGTRNVVAATVGRHPFETVITYGGNSYHFDRENHLSGASI
jgi:hypothetical protein